MSGRRKIIVAGAGAAGMCAAIAAAREGAEVTIIEKTDSCGKKLSMTGNGRCNLSNLDMSEEDYNEAARGRMKTWLKRFGVRETLEFFSSLGLIVNDESGYLYPASGQASTVVNILQSECKRLSVSFIFKEQVKSVSAHDDALTFTVKTDKNEYEADRVILATGGLAGPKSCSATGDGYYICKQLGMEQKDTYPSLTPLLSNDDTLPKETGVRCMAIVSFMIGDGVFASEYGEVQITKNGISGIPVLQASGLVAYHLSKNRPVTASINFFPGYDLKEYEELMNKMMNLPGERTLGDLLTGFCNSNINDMILRRMKLSPSMKLKNVGESMTKCVLMKYLDVRVDISEVCDFKKAQVTRGGVSLGDLDNELQSKKNPGIFVIGELCDVDGRCGGYNLQWAWTSGYLAGEAASCL